MAARTRFFQILGVIPVRSRHACSRLQGRARWEAADGIKVDAPNGVFDPDARGGPAEQEWLKTQEAVFPFTERDGMRSNIPREWDQPLDRVPQGTDEDGTFHEFYPGMGRRPPFKLGKEWIQSPGGPRQREGEARH